MQMLATVWPTLAQASGNDGAALLGFFGAIAGLFCGFFLFLFLIEVIITFLAYRLLSAIPPEYRKQDPGMVWLLLNPVLSLVWNFFVWPRISQSHAACFQAQGRADVGDAGGPLALAFSICMAIAFVPYVGWYCLSFAAIVVLIVYLVKMFGLKAQITTPAR